MSDIGCRSPVFVLSASRSGSTLLRFVLDSHPDLACPPETGVTAACAGLMHSWDILASSDEQAALPADATAALLHGEPNMIGWIGKAAPLNGRQTVVAVRTTEPASVFALRLQDPVSLDFELPEQPDGTLMLPAETWLRLVSGRLAPQYTPASVVATGAADLDLLRQVFPGY